MNKLTKMNDYMAIEAVPQFDLDADSDMIPEIKETIAELLTKSHYFGLSGNQIEGMESFNVLGIRSEIEPIIMFNPKIVEESSKLQYARESCYNVYGYQFMIYRPQWITVQYQSESNETKTETFKGISARLLCQMIDNLEGKTFEKSASKDEYKRGVRKSQIKMKRSFRQIRKLKSTVK